MADNEKLGSTSPEVLLKNATNLDELVNGRESESLPDRFAVLRRTWYGMEMAFNRFITYITGRGEQAVASIGWQELGNWATGLIVDNRQQIVYYNGAWYKYLGELEHVIAGDSPENDGGVWSAANPTGKWSNIGDAALRSNLGSGDGAKLVGGLNYVTPEMSGFVTGIGDADADTAALQWALNQNGAGIELDSTKTYHIHRDVIRHNGQVNIDAGNATIVCDGVFLEVIDGHGSVWSGGVLKSSSTPFTVVYDEQFSIIESGFLGYGRMPFQDETRVDPIYIYQDICCTLVFRSSSSAPVNGLTVNDVNGNYASVIACGYINTKFDNCNIRGGAANAAICVRNGTVDLPTARYGNETSETNKNAFKWARGKNHRITKCTLFECRANGLAVSGSDHVAVNLCFGIDNSESGFKLEQYTVRSWTDTDIANKYVTITDCDATGNWYDGFDVQAAFGSGRPTNLDLYLTMSNCKPIGNRQCGIYGNGNNATLSLITANGNGRHGIAYEDSYHANVTKSDSRNNGWIAPDQYQIRLTGSDNAIEDCKAYMSAALVSVGAKTFQVTDTDNANIVSMPVRVIRGQYQRNFTNYPNRVLIAVGVMVEEFKKNNAATDSFSFLKGFAPAGSDLYTMQVMASDVHYGYTVSRGYAMEAWKKPVPDTPQTVSTSEWARKH